MKLRMEHVLQEAAGVVDAIAVLSGLQRPKGELPARCRCSPPSHISLCICGCAYNMAPDFLPVGPR